MRHTRLAPTMIMPQHAKPNLILLPGMLCDRAYFEPQLLELQQVAEVSVAAYAEVPTIAEMAQLVLSAAPERFAVAGHSMGGRVAQELAFRAPERVIGLGLFATDYRGFRDAEERISEETRRQEWLDRIDREGFARFARQWAPRLVAPSRQSQHSLISKIIDMAERHGRAGVDAHCRAGLSRCDYSDLLPRITAPTLVMTGSEDKVRPPELHRDMASRMPNARLAIIAGAGHMLSMEDPAAVTAEMLPWLMSLDSQARHQDVLSR
jgi:pimeloyl-ACP methyl ester carboxylesterase